MFYLEAQFHAPAARSSAGSGRVAAALPVPASAAGGRSSGILPLSFSVAGGVLAGALPGTLSLQGGVLPVALPGALSVQGGVLPVALPGALSVQGGVLPVALPGALSVAGGILPLAFSTFSRLSLSGGHGRWVCETEPLPAPAWGLAIERREAEPFELEGWAEYIPSTPPRYYRLKVLGGPGLILDSHLASLDNCGDDISDRSVHIFSGEIAADVWGEPIAPHTGQERVENYQNAALIFTGASDTEATSLGVFREPRPGTAVDVTATRIQVTGNGACVAHTQRTTGEIWEELTDEHTPCEALLEAVDALPWALRGEYTSAQAQSGAIEASTGATWLDGPNPRDWEGQQERWVVALAGLVAGRTYRVRWLVAGAGWQEEDFVAEGPSHTIGREVECGETVDGWEVAVRDTGDGECRWVYPPPEYTPLAGLPCAGGGDWPTPIRLALLPDAGGALEWWPEYVPLSLLPYPCISWGPWAERWGCGAPEVVAVCVPGEAIEGDLGFTWDDFNGCAPEGAPAVALAGGFGWGSPGLVFGEAMPEAYDSFASYAAGAISTVALAGGTGNWG